MLYKVFFKFNTIIVNSLETIANHQRTLSIACNEFMFSTKSIGPRIEPWRTPISTKRDSNL